MTAEVSPYHQRRRPDTGDPEQRFCGHPFASPCCPGGDGDHRPPTGGHGVSQTCTAAGNAGTTHGGCVAAAKGNVTPLLADVCDQQAVQLATGTTNRGQCLKVLKSFVP